MDPQGATPQVGDALKSSVDLVIAFGSDFIAFIILAALVAAFAFYFGRDRLLPLIAGVYAAVPLYTFFPFMLVLGPNPWLHLGLFAALVGVGIVAFLGLASWVPSYGIGLAKVLGLSALTAGLILGIAINMLPLHEVYAVSAPTAALFSAKYFFYWLLAGVSGALILGR